jgi:hypothetical protein
VIRGVGVERWRAAGALFHELVELDARSRDERLARVGSSDPDLRAAVEALLDADVRADAELPAPGLGLGGVAAIIDSVGGPGPSLEGLTLGRFRVVERIGSGGMGAVYRAEDVQLRRMVALKFPLLGRDVTGAARVHMLREARAAGALDHPNLCPIYEVGESDAGPFFAMPLYVGCTLKDRLASGGALPLHDALDIVAQLAAGLACAHRAGIVHRDIKPGNVMLLADGTLKLLDFGLARSTETSVAASEGIVGTIHYMAPEQIRAERIDARTDLWALGVLLYEMVAGVRPFDGATAAHVLDAILHAEPRPLRAIDPAIPSDVEALVHALLAKDAAGRPATAGDVIRAVVARRESSPRARVRSVRRRGAIAAGASLAIGALLGAAWWRAPTTLIGRGRLAPRDTLVLADVTVNGLDSTLGPALTTIVRRDFADTRSVAIMPAGEVTSALERMHRRADAALTPALAREVARREGARAFLTGSVSPLGSGYLVTLRLIEAEHGTELASADGSVVVPERELVPALTRTAHTLRTRIGESLRGASAAPAPTVKLTTTSLEASRLLWSARGRPSLEERIVAERAAIALDSSFAYAWLAIGNQLDWLGYRSAAHDSALATAYRLRDGLTVMERAQVGHVYWKRVQLDRTRAIAELQSALAEDSTLFMAVPLNLVGTFLEVRQFERAEALARRIARWPNVGRQALWALARAQAAQGKHAAADSTLARLSALYGPNDAGFAEPAAMLAIDGLRPDAADSLLAWAPESDDGRVSGTRVALSRLGGRLTAARRADDRLHAQSARFAAAAGARLDPAAARALALARTELWLRHDPAAALRRLDAHWKAPPEPQDIQDRIEGTEAAALYAAAGRPRKARGLLAALDRGADTLGRRATYEHRQAALAEIALAEGRYRAAMDAFRRSDLAADGLPVSACAVCILPHLARTAERAGWADSARGFWDAYVSGPAIDRLQTDQWFLATAYRRLATAAAARGDSVVAAGFARRLAALHADPDP